MMLPVDSPSEEETNGNDRGRYRLISDGGQSPLDRMFDSLRGQRRRHLLYYLEERDSTRIEDAARFIAARERDCDPADVPADVAERVRVTLYHVHLPKLAENNIVEYDRRSGAMQFQDPPDGMSDLIDLCYSIEQGDEQRSE